MTLKLLQYIKDEEGTICVFLTIYFIIQIDLGTKILGLQTVSTFVDFGHNQPLLKALKRH